MDSINGMEEDHDEGLHGDDGNAASQEQSDQTVIPASVMQVDQSHISGLAEVDESDPPKRAIDILCLARLWDYIGLVVNSPRGRGQPGPITLYIFQYGQNLKTSSQYALFETKCLQPQAVDRAGAPAQSIQTEIAERLKTLHSNTFDVTDFVWTIWANEISRLPVPQQEAAIQGPPMRQIVPLLRRHPTSLESHVRNVDRSMTLMNSILTAVEEGHAQINLAITAAEQSLKDAERNLSETRVRMDALTKYIEERKEILLRFRDMLQIREGPSAVVDRDNMPDQEDVDHI
ncbi:hypothetical protein BC829DRAFT_418477 [Chytridium lagenaria]|nr:hypothetical protein BC829DRAFT_418477 [Chytridium lagenaria]